MKPIQAYIVCHTHWDREWYLTREQFKTKLVRLVDRVLEAAEADERFAFLLDGQTIVLQDYLSIRPENETRLRKLISRGRVSVGPWYILPDEILVSGEAHIRNYLTGRRIAEKFGGRMNIAYLPDSFGHPEQMPQILWGLSLEAAVFWRGTDDTLTHSEFVWQSPFEEGRILGLHMRHGYGNSARLSEDPAETVPRLKAMMEQLAAYSHGDVVLLMNGSDHILPQKGLLEILENFNRENKETGSIKLDTLAGYLDAVRNDLPELEVHTGELRSGDRSMLLGGTLSTRMYLKQWNARVQRGMERYLEPVMSAARLCGADWNTGGYSHYLWEHILENHPHDSICGCSIDEVHREMMTRFHCVDQLQNTLLKDGGKALADRFATETPVSGAVLLCFEPTQDQLPGYLETVVDFDPVLIQRVNFALSTIDEYGDSICHPPLPRSVTAEDENGAPVRVRLLSAEKAEYMHLQDETAPEIYRVNRCRVALELPPMHCGFHTITLHPHSRMDGVSPAPQRPDRIENAFCRVESDGNGAFRVTDKATGRVYTGVGRLVDRGDAGDEYTYSWPAQDRSCLTSGADLHLECECLPGLKQTLTLRGSLRLPAGLSADRARRSTEEVDCPVSITATLYEDSPVIGLDVTVDNKAKDHLLQLEIPAGVRTDCTAASSAFAVTRHPVRLPVPDQWMEYPIPNQPTHGFVTAGEAWVACDGLTEYEAADSSDGTVLRITLLRCVGWLSRPDLNTRVGNGGWVLETPDAQCQGVHHFRLGAGFCPDGVDTARAMAQCDRFLHPPMLLQQPLRQTALAPAADLAFLSCLPPEVRLSGCKQAEDGDGVVVRAYSIGRQETEVVLPLPAGVTAAFRCDLTEQARTPLPVEQGAVRLQVRPCEIVTLYLQL